MKYIIIYIVLIMANTMTIQGIVLGIERSREGEDGRVTLESKQELATGGSIMHLSCSSDGAQLIATGSNAYIEILDGRTLQIARTLDTRARFAAFACGGEYFVVSGFRSTLGNPAEHVIKIIDSKTEETVSTISGLATFRINDNLGLLTYSAGQTAVVYNLKEKEVVGQWKKNDAVLVNVHNIGATGAIGIDPADFESVLLWESPYDKPPVSLKSGNAIREFQVSPDERIAALGTDGNEVELWDAKSGTRLRNLDKHSAAKGEVRGLLFSPDGAYLASLSGVNSDDVAELIVWETKTWKEIARVNAHSGLATAMAFFPDSKRIATGGDEVKVWRINDDVDEE